MAIVAKVAARLAKMKLRPAFSDDFPDLLAIQVGCIEGLQDTYQAAEIDAWVDYIRRETSDRYHRYHSVVLEDQNANILGFISWKVDGHRSSIECLYILPEFQEEGLGRTLLSYVEDVSQGRVLSVRATLNAEGFYRKHGFERIRASTSRAGFPIILMQKQLNKEA